MDETKISYESAKRVADMVIERLKPYCERVIIGGSLRRMKAMVSDIEIIVLPALDYFQFMAFVDIMNAWEKVRGEPTGKATQRIIYVDGQPYKVDFFIAQPKNWGWILFLRTGSREFNIAFLQKLKAHGITSKDGFLMRNENPINTYEETDVFELANHIFVLPKDRI